MLDCLDQFESLKRRDAQVTDLRDRFELFRAQEEETDSESDVPAEYLRNQFQLELDHLQEQLRRDEQIHELRRRVMVLEAQKEKMGEESKAHRLQFRLYVAWNIAYLTGEVSEGQVLCFQASHWRLNFPLTLPTVL